MNEVRHPLVRTAEGRCRRPSSRRNMHPQVDNDYIAAAALAEYVQAVHAAFRYMYMPGSYPALLTGLQALMLYTQRYSNFNKHMP
jgi:hypothetical protein